MITAPVPITWDRNISQVKWVNHRIMEDAIGLLPPQKAPSFIPWRGLVDWAVLLTSDSIMLEILSGASKCLSSLHCCSGIWSVCTWSGWLGVCYAASNPGRYDAREPLIGKVFRLESCPLEKASPHYLRGWLWLWKTHWVNALSETFSWDSVTESQGNIDHYLSRNIVLSYSIPCDKNVQVLSKIC